MPSTLHDIEEQCDTLTPELFHNSAKHVIVPERSSQLVLDSALAPDLQECHCFCIAPKLSSFSQLITRGILMLHGLIIETGSGSCFGTGEARSDVWIPVFHTQNVWQIDPKVLLLSKGSQTRNSPPPPPPPPEHHHLSNVQAHSHAPGRPRCDNYIGVPLAPTCT